MTGKPRNLAKRINLGLVFGMGEGKLAKECDLPYTIEESHGKTYLRAGDEAQAMFAEYHSKFPFAKRFLTQAGNVAKSRGFVKTILGRHIHFPGGLATHKAGGLVFQGSAADIMKQKCIVINDEFRKTDVLFNLVVHDEFCLSSPKELTPSVMARVQEITQDVPEFRVPILADPGFGPSWWEACQ
jgi:DNA polymerase-1